MIPIAILLTGFSLFSALLLALTHFRAANYQEQPFSRHMGLLLLLALAGLQLCHFVWLHLGLNWVASTPYRMLLFVVAPTFFLYSQPLLRPRDDAQALPMRALHFLPLGLAPLTPEHIALPLAFLVGAGYMLWLAWRIRELRHERAQFQQELILLGLVFFIAVAVAALGLMESHLPDKLFFALYATAIGLAFFLVQVTLEFRPRLSVEVSETARTAYTCSTLANVDCGALLIKLDTTLRQGQAYTDPELSLPSLAEQLGMTSHQLSELINRQLGKGFSRYLREKRIEAAKAMLCTEPSASVLSVGLSVGFSTQSNFYEAFREIEGMTPGQYRKLHLKNDKV